MPCCVHPHYVPCQTMLTHFWDCCDCEHNLVLQAASGRPGDDCLEIVWLTCWDTCRRPSVSTVEGLLEQALQLPCIMPEAAVLQHVLAQHKELQVWLPAPAVHHVL